MRYYDIAAKPVSLCGVDFKSRLEAYWANFFKECFIGVVYEPRIFTLLDGSRYVPDFFVLDTNVWIEIKPTPPTAVEQRKMQEVALKSNQVGIIFFGSFSESVYGNIYLPTTSYSLFSHSFRNLFENLDLIQNEFTFASLLDTSCDSIHQAMNSCCVDWEDIESSLENMNVCPQTYLEGRTSKRPQGIIDPAAFWQDLPASVRVESLAPILKNPKQV